MAVPTPVIERAFSGEKSKSDVNGDVYVSLTYERLSASAQLDRVKSPKAGAVVLFAGCTRDSFQSQTVTHLAYSTYAPLALKTLSSIAHEVMTEHNLVRIAIAHRLGSVDVGEESVLIAVSAPHRKAAWRAGEECLEKVKARVEIWKEEWFEDGGVWRANRDGAIGVPVVSSQATQKIRLKDKDQAREIQAGSTGDLEHGPLES